MALLQARVRVRLTLTLTVTVTVTLALTLTLTQTPTPTRFTRCWHGTPARRCSPPPTRAARSSCGAEALLLFRSVSVLFRMSRSSRELRAELEELKVKLGAQRAKEKNTFGGMFK